MHASPSSQSVGSQKPSTAASTASGRRTRTIIVARNLPESATSTSTPLPSASSSVSSSSQSRHAREAKPVKLNSYAALGSDADVELYERFLSEKKAVLARSLSGDGQALDGGGASTPAMLKGSPKRRTMAQLLPAGEGNDVAAALSATPPLEDAEAAADARQRRAAVVRHRKWLQSLPIHERLAYERQQHAREKWKAVNRQWEAFKQRTVRRLGKPAAQLVMSRAAAYREQVEAYDALQRATPLADKVAGDFWLVSLRNEGTRYVPVGNIFSGLYCPIRESSKLQPRVRRPLDFLDAKGPDDGVEGDDTNREARSTLERRALEALERKKRRLRKQLEALYPHEVEPSRSGQLRVDTADLFEWASAGRGGHHQQPQLHQAPSTRSLLLPLEEEDAGDADASHSHRSTARPRRTARRKGPSLRVFVRDDNEDNGSLDAGPQQQPHVTELTFFADVGVMQQHTVWLENDGTTALQFQWRREDHVDDDALAARLTRHESSPLAEPARVATTSISQRAGVVLPDETLAFVFSFRATRAGVWLERWLLDVDPAPPGLATRQPAAIVRLQSTAVDNFVPVLQRRKLGAAVGAAETTFMAEQVLKHDVIQRVDPRYAVTFPALGEEARRFYDAHRHGAFASVQFSERLMAQCHALYADAQAVLAPPASDPAEDASAPPVDESTASPRDPGTESEVADPPAPAQSVEWDGKLASLQEVATAADEVLRAAYTALKSEQLAAQGGRGADEEDDDEEEDLMEKLLGTKARQSAAQQDALRALEPHFVDDFQSLTLAAHVAPYEPRILSETLGDKLAAMASEAAVVVGIAEMLRQTDAASSGDACGLLQPLLVRALDESVAADAARERVFEDAKRHFQSVKLATKASFRELPRLVLDDSMAPLVLFLQVDLDIANWFTLTPTGNNPTSPLEWKLSQKLLDHRTHVPPKIAAACHSIQALLETVEATGRAPTIVLISELSLPPMTKAMKRAEIAAARAKAAAALAGDAADGAPAPVPTSAEIEMARLRLAAARERQLSLRGVDVVLQRALRARSADHHEVLTIEFVASLQELETAFKPATPRPLTPQADATEASGEGGEPRPPTAELKRRILLLDHLALLSRQALKKPHAAAAAPATPSAAPPAAADKGKAAANDKRKSTAQPPPSQPLKAPVAEPATAVDEEADTIEILPGMSVEMMAAQSLGQRLARVGRFLVADFFPRSWWETAFVYFTAPPPEPTPAIAEGDESPVETTPPPAPRHLLVGPQLLETFTLWQSLFQPTPESRDMTQPMRAIVGGRGLERKLRLIDGLLECANTIYFVGEIAASLHRVLATRQCIKSLRRERKLVPRYESQRLIAAVERLIQKAYRKHVELLLPFDFVVGESPLEPGGDSAGGDDDGDDEDDEDPEEEEDEEDEDEEEDTRKKKSKKPEKPQKPLQEPPEVDTWRSHKSYDGERGIVEVGGTQHAWIRFADVSVELLARASVVDGKGSLLEAAEAEADETPTALPPTTQVIPELDWTQRIFDVGPKSTQVLISDLRTHREQHAGWMFINGTLGALEYRDFDSSTRAIAGLLQAAGGEIHPAPLVTGKSTSQWLEWLSVNRSKRGEPYSPAVSNQTAKLATALSYIIESKPHATLTAFDTTR